MNWLPLHKLLLGPDGKRPVAFDPPLQHAHWCAEVAALAGALQASGAHRVALYHEDAGTFATGLFAAWLAGASVMLPADLRPETRLRWAGQVDCWLTEEDPVPPAAAPLPLAPLNLDHAGLSLCTSGSSGEPKRIDKTLRQLANEVDALERLWGADLGAATVIASVASQHIYGLLFRILWPLCAGRPFLRRQLPFAEDMQRASREHPAFAWVASPALLKRMGDNLDWPALAAVKRVFSSGGALPADAAEALEQRLGQRPTEIFGSSETGGIAWRQADQWWHPFAGLQLSQGQDQALQVASPYLPAGHTEVTQDAVEFAEDGRLRLLGRLDRIVKLEEKRISLALLENALAAHPWVAEARLGVVQGNRASLGALVVLTEAGVQALCQGGRKALTDALRAALAQHCEALALPRRWRLLHQLPLNSQGKLPQAVIEALLQAPRPNAPEVLGETSTEGEWHVRLRVPYDLACFSGHFPSAPVLPGVVQVGWALQLGRALLDLPPRFAGMEVLKFQQLVRPGDLLSLSLRFDVERAKLYFTYRAGEQPCSSGRILLEAADA
ncbi:AMP-binding protein [Pseudomonas sp. RIT-PI-S]|uniref:AMP-binding protein n=1 Tax=Pseudomonas sp. RIT-PI-S TaxID=3035295 RepID=UPI0021DA15AB|nr:AMP-binding protein [Pseudomonas sp. RIT-PI-S]